LVTGYRIKKKEDEEELTNESCPELQLHLLSKRPFYFIEEERTSGEKLFL